MVSFCDVTVIEVLQLNELNLKIQFDLSKSTLMFTFLIKLEQGMYQY